MDHKKQVHLWVSISRNQQVGTVCRPSKEMMTPVTHGAELKAEEGRIVKRAMTTCYVKVPSNSFEQENILM